MLYHPSVRTRVITIVASALPLLASTMYIPTAAAVEPQVEVTQLLKTTRSWDGVQYRAYPDGQPEVSVLRYKIAAHSELPWHIHPVINVAYVLSGQLAVIRKSDGKTIAIGPGDVLPEMVNAPHRGQSGDEPVELIVFYAGTPDASLTIKSEPD
ncbi:cupin domain-containing protein [Burkholderia sp. NLJ2]|uniref:cupin domain-containing protein n=1 Tax=Burkholderia sp. NLJ2 TaxID=3090699 RepID=UPI003C6BEAA3